MARRRGEDRRRLCGIGAVIFATVGTQLPFPRLIEALDRIAGHHKLEIVAQTCDPSAAPRHIQARPHLAPDEFDRMVSQATLIVGHAGIGTLLSALKAGIPVILFPRREAFGEHRNDHQLATVDAVEGRAGVYIARDEDALERLIVAGDLTGSSLGATPSRTKLVDHLKKAINAR